MLGYFVFFLGLFVFLYGASTKNGNHARTVLLGFLGVIMLFVYNLKNNALLPDINVYIDSFDTFKSFSFKDVVGYIGYEEKGYIMFNILSAKICPHPSFFLFLYSLVVVFAYILTIARYSVNIRFSAILYICTSFFSLFILRQYLAVACCLLSIPYAIERKPIPFLIWIVIAFFFHKSSIIFGVVYFLPLLKYNLRSVVILIALGTVVGVALEKLLSVVMTFAGSSHFEAYIVENSASSWKSAAVDVACVSFALLCYRKHKKRLSKGQILFLYMSLCGAILSVIDMLGSSFSAFYRLIPYFSFANIILLPDASRYIKTPKIRFVATIIIISLFSVMLINTIHSQGGFGFVI